VTKGRVILTLSPPSTTKLQYANRLDPDETPSHSASHPKATSLTFRHHFYQL